MNAKAKVLLVEDDPNFGSVMRDYLVMHQYEVTLCENGKKGWSRFSNDTFDLCILDVMMPELDGFTLASEIRKVNPSVPLVFLTSRTMKEDMIKGFSIGADDYVLKPFDAEILLLKLKALLRRSDTGSATDREQNDFNIGSFKFNYRMRELTGNEGAVRLSPREADLLQLLCLHMNDVLTREKALKTIWGEDTYFTGRSMDVFLTRLRKCFKSDPNIEIVNVHSNGFRLIVHK